MGLERQFLTDPTKILASNVHLERADSADINGYYKEKGLEDSFFGDCLFSDRKITLVKEALTMHAHQCEDPDQTASFIVNLSHQKIYEEDKMIQIDLSHSQQVNDVISVGSSVLNSSGADSPLNS